jgi:hypothetical protein
MVLLDGYHQGRLLLQMTASSSSNEECGENEIEVKRHLLGDNEQFIHFLSLARVYDQRGILR